MDDYKNLPYRLGVGLMIINANNKVFVGKRIDTKNPFCWQMPQGGMDDGETPSKAALREMAEEIGSSHGQIIAETKNWYCYDLPLRVIHRMWDGKYKGQKQKWFLIKYNGTDQDINVQTQNPEFNSWRWIKANKLIKVVVPFKKSLYEAVLREFKGFVF